MKVSEIQTEVINRLGPGASTTASKLLRPIDQGVKIIYNKLVTVKEDLFFGTAYWNTINGRQEYLAADGVPTDIKRILSLETRYADQSVRVRATEVKIGSVPQFDFTSSVYQDKYHPRYYKMGNGTNIIIGFIPSHDADGSSYTALRYLKQPTEITDANQVPIIPVDSHYLVVDFALAVAQLGEDEDGNAYQSLLRRFDADLERWIQSEYPINTEGQFTQD
jgi:hypothetical protein